MSARQLEEYLSEYQNENTRKLKRRRLKAFLRFANITLDELTALDVKDARHLILTTQVKMKEQNVRANTIIAYISAVTTFFDYLDKPIKKLKGRIVDREMAMGYHIFGNGDLSQMFEYADIRTKALLAVSTSLGWEISAIADMDRALFKDIVEKAVEAKQQFVFFETQRKKTGKPRLAVLNPLAIEWLHKWFEISTETKTVFGIGMDQISNLLKQNVKQSKIKTTGKIRFHNLRGWVMGSLSKAGFNTFEIKYVMGKSIPATDLTYLRTLQTDIEEKYSQVYDKYLSIKPTTKLVQEKNKRIEDLEKAVLRLQETMSTVETINNEMMKSHLRQNEHTRNVTATFQNVLSILKRLPFDEQTKKEIAETEKDLYKIQKEAEKY